MPRGTARLGKGLSAIVAADSESSRPLSGPNPEHGPNHLPVRYIPLEQIAPNPRQPRTNFGNAALDELAQSIRAKGVVQPIIVRTAGEHAYELVAGERRLRAAKLADLAAIPAVVRDLSDSESLEIALIENLQREDLTPLERATAYQHYLDSFDCTIEDLSKRLAESRANISNYLRLLKLQPAICYMLGAGELGMGQARAVATIADHRKQLALARLAARRNLSVRQVEALASAARESVSPPATVTDAPEQSAARRHLDDVEQALSKNLGLRVRLRPGRRKNSGKVVISYGNLEEFDRVAELLGGDAKLE